MVRYTRPSPNGGNGDSTVAKRLFRQGGVIFGFAYGTLPDHAESGEEKFIVEWNEADDAVCYDILAFSRPNHFLARLGYPLIRRLQKRFAQDSAAAMKRGVGIVGG